MFFRKFVIIGKESVKSTLHMDTAIISYFGLCNRRFFGNSLFNYRFFDSRFLGNRFLDNRSFRSGFFHSGLFSSKFLGNRFFFGRQFERFVLGSLFLAERQVFAIEIQHVIRSGSLSCRSILDRQIKSQGEFILICRSILGSRFSRLFFGKFILAKDIVERAVQALRLVGFRLLQFGLVELQRILIRAHAHIGIRRLFEETRTKRGFFRSRRRFLCRSGRGQFFGKFVFAEDIAKRIVNALRLVLDILRTENILVLGLRSHGFVVQARRQIHLCKRRRRSGRLRRFSFKIIAFVTKEIRERGIHVIAGDFFARSGILVESNVRLSRIQRGIQRVLQGIHRRFIDGVIFNTKRLQRSERIVVRHGERRGRLGWFGGFLGQRKFRSRLLGRSIDIHVEGLVEKGIRFFRSRRFGFGRGRFHLGLGSHVCSSIHIGHRKVGLPQGCSTGNGGSTQGFRNSFVFFFPERIERIHIVNTAIAAVAVSRIFLRFLFPGSKANQLIVSIAHALLRRKAERILFQDALAFFDTIQEFALLEQNLGANQHAGNVARIKLQTGIHAGKRIVDVSRHELIVGKPGESHRLRLLLANRLFQGIQCNGHLSLQGKQDRFVRQKNRNSFANDIGTGARLVHKDLGQSFRNLFASRILEGSCGTGLVDARQKGVICHTEFTPSLGAAKNIQEFIVEHKAFIINNL